MNYFKLLISIVVVLLFSQTCYAEHWYTLNAESRRYIAIDLDSINYHNNSLYYNVHYIVKATDSRGQYSTIQSKGNKAGIVKTCKPENYKTCLNASTEKVATDFKTLTETSLLYKANLAAQKVYESNTLKNQTSK